MTSKIIVEDYGDLISKIREMDLVFYECFGSYQGDYLCVLFDQETKRFFFYKDSYGSCSGCDWLESEKDWNTGEVEYKEANDFVSQMRPLYITHYKKYEPIEIFEMLTQNTEDCDDFREITHEKSKEISEKINSFVI